MIARWQHDDVEAVVHVGVVEGIVGAEDEPAQLREGPSAVPGHHFPIVVFVQGVVVAGVGQGGARHRGGTHLGSMVE